MLLLLALVPLFTTTQSDGKVTNSTDIRPDVTLAFTSGYYKTLSCVASGNAITSALSWSTKDDTKVKSSWKSGGTDGSALDCHVYEYHECAEKWRSDDEWTTKSAMDVTVPLVTDYRWESLPTYDLDQGTAKTFQMYNPNAPVRTIWETGVSIRTNSNAHIFLLEGEELTTPAYWLILGGWKEPSKKTRCVIRKCVRGIPPPKTYKDKKCLEEQVMYLGAVVNDTSWLHTKLRWDSSSGTVSLTMLGAEKPFLEFIDPTPLNPKYVGYRSSDAKGGQWRWQDFRVLGTSHSSASLYSPYFTPRWVDALCLSLLYHIASQPDDNYLQISVEDRYNGVQHVADLHQTGGVWQYFRSVVQLSVAPELRVRIQAFSDGSTADGDLFHVDSIRECSLEGEVRVLTTSRNTYEYPKKTECHVQQFPGWGVKPQAIKLSTVTDQAGCAADMFGANCSESCAEILGTSFCRDTVLCEPTAAGGSSTCRCGAGLYTEKCNYECSPGSYGSACSYKCGSCSNYRNCDAFTGRCYSGTCTEGYVPPYCNISYPYLTSAPELVEAAPRGLKLTFNPSEVTGFGTPTTYSVYYKSAQSSYWYPAITMSAIGDRLGPIEFSLNDLEPLTEYEVRVQLYVHQDDGYLTSTSSVVPTLQATTICKVPEEDTITMKVESTAVFISWEAAQDGDACKLNNFKVWVGSPGTNGNTYYVNSLPVVVSPLTPFTNYSFQLTLIQNDQIVHMQNFKTMEAAPTGVVNITADIGVDNMNITWAPPKFPNGMIRHYRIMSKHAGFVACGSGSITVGSLLDNNVSQPPVPLSKLLPYSWYVVYVSGFTVDYGINVSETFSTAATELPSETVELSTAPKISTDSIKVSWKKLDCSQQGGPISGYSISLTSIGSVSKNRTEVKNVTWLNVEFTDLQPYTDYSVTVNVLRRPAGAINPNTGLQLNITTLPAVPGKVLDLSHYSSGPSWISIRWLPPDPPKGVLATFKITLVLKGKFVSSKEVVASTLNCEIWDRFMCFTIKEKLKAGEAYTIEVSASNNGTGYGGRSYITAKTMETESTAPLNLRVANRTGVTATLLWDHPDKPYGRIRNFVAQLDVRDSWLRQRADIPNLSLTFEYKVQRSYSHEVNGLMPSTVYQVKVFAETVREGASDTIEVTTPISFPTDLGNFTLIAESVMDSTVSLAVPAAHPYLTNTSAYFVIVYPMDDFTGVESDESTFRYEGLKAKILYEPKKVFEKKHVQPPYWIAAELQPTDDETSFVIGSNLTSGDKSHFGYGYWNRPLVKDVKYGVFVVVVNAQDDDQIVKIAPMHRSQVIVGRTIIEEDSPILWPLIFLLLIPIIIFIIVKRVDWKKFRKDEIELHIAQNLVRENNKADTIGSKKRKTLLITEVEADEMPAPMQQGLSQRLSRRVKIVELEEYVKNGLKSGELQRQHALFPRGQTRPWDYGRLPQNKSKNRYGNLVAYDETRVHLRKFPDDEFSDYINANYIDGYNSPKFYIATQGPKPNTVEDFWRMIWQEQVQVISMLANVIENGKTKCEQYWPEMGQEMTFGAIKVFTAGVQLFADYTFRQLNVMCKGKKRQIQHLHFTSWPDHGVPLYPQSVASYLKKILATPWGNGPILVHCSAGVGRTGTIVLSDICLRMAAKEGSVDILGFQQSIREQRANMVDNLEQYKLVHLVLLECLTMATTALECNSELGPRVDDMKQSGEMRRQLQRLAELQWQDQALRHSGEVEAAVKQQDAVKLMARNRNKDIVPGLHGRVYLTRFPLEDATSDYINAIYVDGFRTKDQFLATELPLAESIGQYWRLVAEKNVPLILVLHHLPSSESDEFMSMFRPMLDASLQPVPHLTVSLKQQSHTVDWTSSVLQLTDSSNTNGLPQQQVVRMLQLNGWQHKDSLPSAPRILIELWQEAERLYIGKGPILLTCHDGVSGCGLFLSLAFLVEKIKLEQQCDVCQAVRTVRQNRKQFVSQLDQFEFLYDSAVNFMEAFQTYANFN